jgi:hypothetical protein
MAKDDRKPSAFISTPWFTVAPPGMSAKDALKKLPKSQLPTKLTVKQQKNIRDNSLFGLNSPVSGGLPLLAVTKPGVEPKSLIPDRSREGRSTAKPTIIPPGDTLGSAYNKLHASVGPDYSNLDDFLASFMERFGGSTGGSVSRAPFDASAAKVAAMYRQLEDSFGPDAERLKTIFDEAGRSYQSNADQATSNLSGLYSGINAERMRQLAALGIEEAAAVTGEGSARDEANVLSNIARRLEATQGRNTGYRESALTLNEQMKGVSRLQGAAQQAAIQDAYARAVAEASSGGGGPRMSDALSYAKAAMSEQDKMIKGLTPEEEGYTYADIDALYNQALNDPRFRTSQERQDWINTMMRAQR